MKGGVVMVLVLSLIWTSCKNPAPAHKDSALSDTVQVKDSSVVSVVSDSQTDDSLGEATGDTVFLLRNKTKDYYHAIYIEKNRQSKFYQWLTDFGFDNYDKEEFDTYYRGIKDDSSIKIKRFNRSDLPSEWVPLYSLKGRYYLYAPSDWGNAGRKIITDSTLVFWFMDGPYPIPLSSFRKNSNNQYALTGIGRHSFDSARTQLIIHMIDSKNKIAVWEFPAESTRYRYRLYVARENAPNFDMVVNYCKDAKQMEFSFDQIDYSKLLGEDKHR